MSSVSVGSSNGHSPVLNLSKSGGLDQGSTGDQSDRSEGHSPPPSIRDEEENISDDNVSDVDEREEKEEGMLCCSFYCMFPFTNFFPFAFCRLQYFYTIRIINTISYANAQILYT